MGVYGAAKEFQKLTHSPHLTLHNYRYVPTMYTFDRQGPASDQGGQSKIWGIYGPSGSV